MKTKLSLILSFLSFGLMAQNSLVQNVPFENIGPSIMSGRVVDLDVNPEKPSEFYVAYASGGLWYTNNNGTSFDPIMDNAPTQNMGDIAVDWKSGTIWVGTGENNSSRSSYAGIGIFKSSDHGASWEFMGLEDTQHIGRIIINPNNPDEVLVGAMGHLYTPNQERGVFKTTDGGKTWKKTLYIDELTGVIDLSFVPGDFNTVYASTWERSRKAWNFVESGKGSGIYKSSDAGATWELISTEQSGFPQGDGVGRIGLAVYDASTAYVVLDNQDRRASSGKKSSEQGLTKEDFKTMSEGDFMDVDSKDLEAYLRSNRFPKQYTASSVRAQVKKGEVKPADLATYLEDANSIMFDTPVKGAEIYVTTDGGKTWSKTHEGYLDGVYSSYGYYFGEIRVSPSNKNKLYVMGVPFIRSDDAGKTWKSISKENVHSDHQALWVNGNLEGHLINGNDGGVNISYDDGDNWIKNNAEPLGQFYYINVDNEEPYNVYGGLQDNGVWKGPSNYQASKRWEGTGHYPYESIGGGDGMQVQIDSRNSNIVYTGSQYGFYFRVDLATGKRVYLQPKHELGESPYRWNWMSPILLSSHNQDIFYMGSNKLHRSFNRGEDLEPISPDLTLGGKPGDVAFGTLTTIAESPFEFGFLYTGSDDGLVHRSLDGGVSWTRVSDAFPKDLWVTRIVASEHEKSRVYVSLTGYRNDDFKPYVFVSEDRGETWSSIQGDLPEIAAVNVIKEDPKNENILYLGTDNALYVSLDKGTSWQKFGNLPPVAMYDLVIQDRENELLVGTHGRSIYKADISALRSYDAVKDAQVTLLKPESVRYSSRWGSSWGRWYEAMEPEISVVAYSGSAAKLTLEVLGDNDYLLQRLSVDGTKGFNYISYDLSMSEAWMKKYAKKNKGFKAKKAANGTYYLPKGNYTLRIGKSTQTLEIK
ncbi:MAG: WD40/YVTN/BNR-like repeat-containing protein [Flavobacteriaceae bacterium]